MDNVFHSKLNELLSFFQEYARIYTGGSKIGSAVGAAAVSQSCTQSLRLPDNASIFSAEAQAILLALDHIKQSQNQNTSYCLTPCHCCKYTKPKHPFILDICNATHDFITSGHSIIFARIPSRVGITGNTAADTVAKQKQH